MLISDDEHYELPYDITVICIEPDMNTDKFCIYGTAYNITVLLAKYNSIEMAHDMVSHLRSVASQRKTKYDTFKFPKEETVINDRNIREEAQQRKELQLKERM